MADSLPTSHLLNPINAGLSPQRAWVSEAVGGQETVLLVEDETGLLNLIRMTLQCHGYRVLAADSGEEALKVWARRGAEIDLLFTDVVMPGGISGLELAAQLTAQRPGLRVIFSSGRRDLARQGVIPSEGVSFLPKPYTPDELGRAVRACLDENRCEAAAAA